MKLYVEGGGDARSLHITCREGFRKLLERTGFQDRMPSIRACGSRYDAYDDFTTAHGTAAHTDYPVLLVDSEGPVDEQRPAWLHLQATDDWPQPEGANDDQAQLMVQCMETWCVADRAALKSFFGNGFRLGSLPPLNDLEARSKDAVYVALSKSTRDCARPYRKGRRSFELVGQLDPEQLKRHLPHFVRFCQMLDLRL